jgi:hypothetical protein
MSLEGAFANGSVAHMPFRNVYGCYLDTIPARLDGCVASFCLKTLVLRASFTGNHTNRDERASREKTIAKKQREERERGEISDLSCPGNLSLSLSLYRRARLYLDIRPDIRARRYSMRDYPRLVRASRVAVLVGRLLSFAKKSTDDGDGGGEEAASKKKRAVLSLFFPTAQASKNFCSGLPFSFPEKGSCFFLPFFLAQKQHRLKRY